MSYTYIYIHITLLWALEELPNGGTTLEVVLPGLQLIFASCAFIKKLIQKMEILTIFCFSQ